LEAGEPAIDGAAVLLETPHTADDAAAAEVPAGVKAAADVEPRLPAVNELLASEGCAAAPSERCAVRVIVESALELPGPRALHFAAATYSTYASVVWQRCRQRRRTTHAVTVHEAPPLPGRAAAWGAEVELDVDWGEFTDGLAAGPCVLLNVWARAAPEGAAARQLLALAGTSAAKSSAVPAPDDILIGCAVVDLSSLAGEVKGKFALVDMRQAAKGAIKATITANSTLARRLLAQRSLAADESGVVAAKGGGAEAPGSAAAAEARLEVATPEVQAVSPVPAPRHAAAAAAAVEHSTAPVVVLCSGGSSNPASAAAAAPAALQPPKQQYAWSGSDSDEDDVDWIRAASAVSSGRTS
jgi:hypothetical protein